MPGGWLLNNGGCDWAIWRPADWESGRIQAELAALARPDSNRKRR